MSRIKNSVRNIFWGYFSKILNLIFPFLLRTVIIHYLGAEYLGINSLFTSILQVLSFSELGFGTAIIYSMYRPIAENKKEQICALLNLYRKVYYIIGGIVLAVGLAITPFIKFLIKDSYPSGLNIYLVYLVFLLNTVVSYFMFAYKASLLNAFQRNDLESKAALIISISRYIVQIAIISIIKSYYGYLIALVTFTFLNNILNHIIAVKYFPEYICSGTVNKDQKNEIKKNVLALACHKFGGTVVNSVDNIVISSFLGLVVVAKYSNYYYIMNSLESLVIIFFTSITSILGNILVLESKDISTLNFKRVMFLNSWMTCVCTVVMLCIYQDFITAWAGMDYLFSQGIIILFGVYFFFHMIRRTIIVFRDASGMWYDNRWQPIASGTFNLVMNIILVQIIGIYGVLISTILSMVVIDIPWETRAICSKIIKLSFLEYISTIIKSFAVTVIVSVVSFYLCSYIHSTGVTGILIKTLVSFILTNIVLILIYRNNDNFNYFTTILKKLSVNFTIKYKK